MSERDLVSTIYGELTNRVIDMPLLWTIIDSYPEEESTVMHLLYDKRGYRTELTQVALAKSLGIGPNLLRGIISRVLRKLRHPNTQRQYVRPPKTYSHRNGETEPPTILEHHYWFQAAEGSYYEATFGCYYIMPAEVGRGPYLSDDETPIDKLIGRWWGPVMPPWEEA